MKITSPILNMPLHCTDDKTFTLKDFQGKPVVLYFYPKDNTPGCTLESQDFRDHYPAFLRLGSVLLGVSKDNLTSHEKFKCKYELPFPLIADTEGKLCEAFDVIKEKSMFGKKYMGIERSTFIINAQGELVKSWRKVKVSGHAEEVLQSLENEVQGA